MLTIPAFDQQAPKHDLVTVDIGDIFHRLQYFSNSIEGDWWRFLLLFVGFQSFFPSIQKFTGPTRSSNLFHPGRGNSAKAFLQISFKVRLGYQVRLREKKIRQRRDVSKSDIKKNPESILLGNKTCSPCQASSFQLVSRPVKDLKCKG